MKVSVYAKQSLYVMKDFIKDIAAFYALLSQDEQEKAQRFRFEKDKNQYKLLKINSYRLQDGH